MAVTGGAVQFDLQVAALIDHILNQRPACMGQAIIHHENTLDKIFLEMCLIQTLI